MEYYPEDWTSGDKHHYPMLIPIDGGYQDMQRLSPDFRQGMRDYAQPADNHKASWFDEKMWRTLCKLEDKKPEGKVLLSHAAAQWHGLCSRAD